jgi:hypothetical protein
MSSQPSLNESPAGGFWSEKRVAAYFDVSERTVRRWAETGVIEPPKKIGGARRYNADKIQRVGRGASPLTRSAGRPRKPSSASEASSPPRSTETMDCRCTSSLDGR